jgi:hypothetical protein
MEAQLIAGARDSEPVKGLTHGFYKYPARFSPLFVRAAIQAFSRPGDFCWDPHVGGGTTLVEALALGRNAVGIDISTLAEFVSRAKTTVFTRKQLALLTEWATSVETDIDIHARSVVLSDYAERGYYKHLDHPKRWRLRKAIEQAVASAVALNDPLLEMFGRCAVLRTAQWALDGRKSLPTITQFRAMLRETARDMIAGAAELQNEVRKTKSPKTMVKVIQRTAAGVQDDARIKELPSPSLVVTSPPYPGVHVLYHRWQVDGRKEAPLPFMIANKLDGAGSSYYTMGDRKYPALKTYYDNILATMSSVCQVADEETIFVQMVAFSEPEWQLPRYLETMKAAGLEEVFLTSLRGAADGRLWRAVPGRRWYSDQRGDTPGSNEVVLFHRKITQPAQRRSRQARHKHSIDSSASA